MGKAIKSIVLTAGCLMAFAVLGKSHSIDLRQSMAGPKANVKMMPSPLGGDVFLAEADGYDGVRNAVVPAFARGTFNGWTYEQMGNGEWETGNAVRKVTVSVTGTGKITAKAVARFLVSGKVIEVPWP